MCEIIANQSEADYGQQTRSVRLMGHSTSIRLEAFYWRVLDGIAQMESFTTTSRLLNQLYEEIAALQGTPPSNFASLLRVGCVKYIDRKRMPLPLSS